MVGIQKAETAGNCGNRSVSVAEQIGGNTDFHLIDVMLRGKSGFPQEEIWQPAEKMADCPHCRLRGLMAIPPANASEDETRRFFAKMRGLYEEAAQRYAGSVDMQYLSMGMSGDYPLAIAEGANIVRIGTAIYGPRDYSAKA